MTLATRDMASEGANVSDPLTVVYDTAPDGTMSLVEIRLAASNKVLVFNK
jgi:hypothetical protein